MKIFLPIYWFLPLTRETSSSVCCSAQVSWASFSYSYWVKWLSEPHPGKNSTQNVFSPTTTTTQKIPSTTTWMYTTESEEGTTEYISESASTATTELLKLIVVILFMQNKNNYVNLFMLYNYVRLYL